MSGRNETPFMTGRDAAAYLQIGKTKLYEMAKAGEIPVIMIGGIMRFRKDELDEHFKSKKSNQPA